MNDSVPSPMISRELMVFAKDLTGAIDINVFKPLMLSVHMPIYFLHNHFKRNLLNSLGEVINE